MKEKWKNYVAVIACEMQKLNMLNKFQELALDRDLETCTKNLKKK